MVMGVILLVRQVRMLALFFRGRAPVWVSVMIPVVALAVHGQFVFPYLYMIVMGTVYSVLLAPVSMVIGLIGAGFCLNGWEDRAGG